MLVVLKSKLDSVISLKICFFRFRLTMHAALINVAIFIEPRFVWFLFDVLFNYVM